MELPTEISEAIETMDLKESSERKARTGIVSYTQFVNEQQGDFSTEDKPQEHARLIHQYFTQLGKDGYTRETVSGRWTWVSRLYNELSSDFLNEFAFLSENPIELLEERENKTKKSYLPEESEESQIKRQYYVDKDDFELMRDNATSPSFRNETLIRLMWTTGLRCSEVCELKLKNVNLEENLLEDIWVPKTNDTRSLWIPDTTVWALDQYINAGYRDSFSYAEESEYVFLTNRAPKMHRQTPNKVVKRTADNAGIQEVIGQTQDGGNRYKVTAHAMRRGHGMHLWKQGKSLPTIQDRLNHSSSDQTDSYLPISTEETKQKIEGVTF